MPELEFYAGSYSTSNGNYRKSLNKILKHLLITLQLDIVTHIRIIVNQGGKPIISELFSYTSHHIMTNQMPVSSS